MKKNTRILGAVALTAALAGFSTPAAADNGKIVFSGNTGSQKIQYYGTQKKENYDVAVLLADKNLKGKKISAIRAPFASSEGIGNVKVWITKKLNLENKVNVPDVMSLDATFDGTTASATLPDAYTIDSDTLYVGYSFDVTALDDYSKYPVAITTSQSDAGFFLHSSRTYRKWMDKAAQGSSAMEIDLDGAAADAAGIASLDDIYGQVNTPTTVTLTLRNHGYNGVKSVKYSYKAGDKSGGGYVELANPIPAYYNASADVDIKLDEIAAKGKYPLTVSIDEVNGGANAEDGSDETTFIVYNYMPKHNPVMEEYTGTWCGWCPRGFVALAVMNRLHPDFIGLSYHNGDAMEVMSSSLFPTDVSGFPSADMDRKYGETDPYYGNNNSDFGIETLWKSEAAKIAPAAAAVEAAYTDGGEKIAAKATFVFPEDVTDADKYRVEFVLVADDLHGTGSTWEQHNYYKPENKGSLPSPEGDQFFEGNSVLTDLHFDDVVVATTRVKDGVKAQLPTLPAAAAEGEPVEVTGEFETAKVVSTSGTSLIQDTSKMRIVALLLNADGTVANAAKANVTGAGTTGISSVGGNASLADAPAAVYDLQGRRLSTMQPGVNIVKMTSGRTVKVVKK